ncbi:hypothetical protein PYCCODRAFT_632075 [Trametes coccinea BRFM310]|uniref:Uncharacterized protein n=1 Tax=Trametes coccinea (strain BRFM310) TaxID=1353009 RepID=A0A1Y2J2Q8_TRAC3|nr:hypothetical protein PYCCODRAFT_632075 [Trametes coccinea BRFM310]
MPTSAALPTPLPLSSLLGPAVLTALSPSQPPHLAHRLSLFPRLSRFCIHLQTAHPHVSLSSTRRVQPILASCASSYLAPAQRPLLSTSVNLRPCPSDKCLQCTPRHIPHVTLLPLAAAEFPSPQLLPLTSYICSSTAISGHHLVPPLSDPPPCPQIQILRELRYIFGTIALCSCLSLPANPEAESCATGHPTLAPTPAASPSTGSTYPPERCHTPGEGDCIPHARIGCHSLPPTYRLWILERCTTGILPP